MPPSPPNATRVVRLPRMPSDPLDFQLNYYNYRDRRLMRDSDIFVGEALVYQVDKLGCRGPGPSGRLPILALFGDDEVHGPIEGGFAERVRIDGFQTVNAGIEGLTLEGVAARFEELCAAVPVAAAVVAPPRRGLPPDEAAWRALIDRFTGPPVVAFLPLRGPDADRFNQVLAQSAASDARFVIPVPPPGAARSMAARLLGRKDAVADPAALIRAHLQRPLAALGAAAPVAGAAPDAAPPASGGHGPGDTGRNYPLW